MSYDQLIKRIDQRHVYVDACLPAIMADRLSERGIKAVYVEALGPSYFGRVGHRLTDAEILNLMGVDDVLLTRDYALVQKMGPRAILLRLGYGVKEHKWRPFKPWVEREYSRRMFDSEEYRERVMICMNQMFGRKAVSKAWTEPWDSRDYQGDSQVAAGRPKGEGLRLWDCERLHSSRSFDLKSPKQLIVGRLRVVRIVFAVALARV